LPAAAIATLLSAYRSRASRTRTRKGGRKVGRKRKRKGWRKRTREKRRRYAKHHTQP